MSKIKEFFSNPKKTAILGLVGAIISIGYYVSNTSYTRYYGFDFEELLSSIFANISMIGLIIYFSIVLMRIFKKGGNIKIANTLLIICFILQPITSIFRGIYRRRSNTITILHNYHIVFV